MDGEHIDREPLPRKRPGLLLPQRLAHPIVERHGEPRPLLHAVDPVELDQIVEVLVLVVEHLPRAHLAGDSRHIRLQILALGRLRIAPEPRDRLHVPDRNPPEPRTIGLRGAVELQPIPLRVRKFFRRGEAMSHSAKGRKMMIEERPIPLPHHLLLVDVVVHDRLGRDDSFRRPRAPRHELHLRIPRRQLRHARIRRGVDLVHRREFIEPSPRPAALPSAGDDGSSSSSSS